MNLTRRKFLIGGAAVAAVVTLPSISFASGGVIPKTATLDWPRKYTYVCFHNIPLYKFGNRMPWVSAEISINCPIEKFKVGLKNISGKIDETSYIIQENEVTSIEYSYMGSMVTAIEGEAEVKKVWLDGVESKDYTVIHGHEDTMTLCDKNNSALEDYTVYGRNP